jgi:hypothetical protein
MHLLGYNSVELIGKDSHALIHHSRLDGSPYTTEDCPIYRRLLLENLSSPVRHHQNNKGVNFFA